MVLHYPMYHRLKCASSKVRGSCTSKNKLASSEQDHLNTPALQTMHIHWPCSVLPSQCRLLFFDHAPSTHYSLHAVASALCIRRIEKPNQVGLQLAQNTCSQQLFTFPHLSALGLSSDGCLTAVCTIPSMTFRHTTLPGCYACEGCLEPQFRSRGHW